MKVIKNVEETRIISRDELRNICIEKNWCNACTNEEYEELLSVCEKSNITAVDIASIAATIDEYTIGRTSHRCWRRY